MDALKSSLDTHKYKYKSIILDNKMECIIISDPSTDISATALSVGVGYFEDGSVYGLAHFVEHMLFMGSKKYPMENYYHKFISNSGGESNAHTTSDHTCYYFSCLSTYFDNAIDIFSRFFIDPLLSKESINRELNAVNSEHQKNITADDWRYHQILKCVANKKHPFSTCFQSTSQSSLDNILISF